MRISVKIKKQETIDAKPQRRVYINAFIVDDLI